MVKTNQCTQPCLEGPLALWVHKSQYGTDFVSLLEGPVINLDLVTHFNFL